MPLPNNNLPTGSQQWAREVEKQLAALNQAETIRSSNAFGLDAANQANAASLSSLLLDQVELKTYSKEIGFSRTQTFTGTGFQNLDTTELTQEIFLNKERTLIISYSALCRVRNTFVTASEPYSWYITALIKVDGEPVSYSDIQKERNFSIGTNPYSSEYDSSQMVNNKVIALPAGFHTISVVVDTGAVSSTATTEVTVSGDDLSITIIK